MPRKSNTDMIAALEAKLAEARAKEQEKAVTRTNYLVEAIKSIDERIAKAEDSCAKAIAAATATRDERVAKLEQKRVDLDAELAELASESATTATFSGVSAEEVSADDDTDEV